MHIAMVAAENGALERGKVGGIGDVIRDVPLALAERGHTVSVITPGYMLLAKQNESELLGTVTVSFVGREETLELYRVMARSGVQNDAVEHYVVDHPLFAACGAGQIYCDDDQGPFATDASKFALFCLGVAQLLLTLRFARVDQLHLHDWHAAPLALIRHHLASFKSLQDIPVAYTIHNLSLQGVRPLSGHISSLHAWFPDLVPELSLLQDPVHLDCVNLMRAGINLADTVHAVSPSYAEEILLPSDAERAFVGGEGLEADLVRVKAQGKLFGILNGCDYEQKPAAALARPKLYDLMEACLNSWVGDRVNVRAVHFHALGRLSEWRKKRKAPHSTMISIGRITGQKSKLFIQQMHRADGADGSLLEQLLQYHPDSHFIMLGSGDSDYEQFFTQVMQRCDNFLFLCGFSESLANTLYSCGDMFLMPSSFEPCGISQLLAMRVGTPCVVHHVGGLRDTVREGENGFVFAGAGLNEQAQNMLLAVERALVAMADKQRWAQICQSARASRFTWQDAIDQYLNHLYR